MSELFNEYFGNIKDIYNETMSEIGGELKAIAEYPETECSECDAPEYIEAAVAESHIKIISAVIGRAMKMVGDSIFKAMSEEE
ncbi:MAG: hypothetical protein NC452_08565 [Eubacterium sp.]|nr:hypothetical protein [Eubacterium sp.]